MPQNFPFLELALKKIFHCNHFLSYTQFWCMMLATALLCVDIDITSVQIPTRIS